MPKLYIYTYILLFPRHVVQHDDVNNASRHAQECDGARVLKRPQGNYTK